MMSSTGDISVSRNLVVASFIMLSLMLLLTSIPQLSITATVADRIIDTFIYLIGLGLGSTTISKFSKSKGSEQS